MYILLYSARICKSKIYILQKIFVLPIYELILWAKFEHNFYKKGDYMKQRSTRILSVLLAILLFCSVFLPCSFAATAEEWDENWDRLKNDASAVSMFPGSDPSSMNFTWLSPTKDCVVMFEIATDSSMKNGKFLKVERTHTALYGWKNDVTAENLKSNTTLLLQSCREWQMVENIFVQHRQRQRIQCSLCLRHADRPFWRQKARRSPQA